MISFSQNGEDVILSRVLSKVQNGNYVDIGSGHPISDSVTKHFYDLGWSGINVEPDSRLYPLLEIDRLRDLNLFACVSDSTDEVDYWQTETEGWSTTNIKIASDISKIENITHQKRLSISLEQVLNMSSGDIHFLKIDCEGDESAILNSYDFKEKRPWIIIVETIFPRENKSNFETISFILQKRFYKAVLFDGLNHYFVDETLSDLANSDLWYVSCVRDSYIKASENRLLIENTELLELNNKTNIALTNSMRDHEITKNALTNSMRDHEITKNALTNSMRDHEITKNALTNSMRDHEITKNALTNSMRDHEITKNALTNSILDLDDLRNTSSLISRELESKTNILKSIEESRVWRWSAPYRKFRNKINQNLNRLKTVYQYNPGIKKFSAVLVRYICKKIIIRKQFFIGSEFQNKQDIEKPPAVYKHKILQNYGKSTGSRIGIDELKILPAISQNLYVLVGATLETESNTGVQKVVKSVVLELLAQERFPIFVKVEKKSRRVVKLNLDEIKSFAEKIDVNFEDIIKYHEPQKDVYPSNSLLLVPEVPYTSTNDPLICEILVSYCNSFNLVPTAIYYDSIPLTTPGYEYGIDSHLSYLRFLSQCLLITCISQTSLDELNRLFTEFRFEISRTKPQLITQHLPLPKSFMNLTSKEVTPLLGKEFVLTVGTVEPRKNQITTLLAFSELQKETKDLPILVIAGGVRPDVSHWKNIGDHQHVIWLNYVTDEEMIWLYQNCLFTIFISKSEGFGYPVLESAHFGKVCITSRHGSMGEIAEALPFVKLQNVEDVQELKDKIIKLNNDLQNSVDNSDLEMQMEANPWDKYIKTLLDKTLEASLKPLENVEILYWIDHTSKYDGNSGIQRVVRGLANSILSQSIPMTPIIWNHKDSNFELASDEDLNHLAKWSGPNIHLWNRDFSAKPSNRVDRILLIPELTTYSSDSNFLKKVLLTAKSLEMRTCVIFHDALPVLMPEIYSVDAADKHSKYMEDLMFANAILATTNTGRDDLVEFVLRKKELDASLITRIWTVQLPSLFINEDRANLITNNAKKTGKKVSILCVGTLEPRKNHVRLIEAFEEVVGKISKDNIELIIVGKGVDNKLVEFVVDASKRLPVKWLGPVTDSQLKELYSSCDFTVFPSLGEGFGLPLTESLGFGKPVLCGSGGALFESAIQGGCMIVDVKDVKELSNGILKLATDMSFRNSLKEEINHRDFSTWNDYATKVLEVSFRLKRKKITN